MTTTLTFDEIGADGLTALRTTRPGALRAAAQLTGRQIRNFSRQPYFLGVTLLQPIVWLVLFGQLFRSVVHLPGFGAAGTSYIAFLTPGIVMMTALFSNGWSGMSLITDMERGILDRLLASPARRSSLIAGSIGYQAFNTLIQTVIIIALGVALGARFHGGVAAVAVLALAGILLGCAVAGFSNAVALAVRKEESVIALSQMTVLPLSFLSTTFLPASVVPGWIAAVAKANPVNWAVEAGRASLYRHVDWGMVGLRLFGLALVALALSALCTRAYGGYLRKG